MFSRGLWLLGVIVACALAALPVAAQLKSQEADPLARIRAAANEQACSVSETSACAQANPKIVAAALGASPLADTLRRLDEIRPRVTGTPGMDRAAAWAMAAFREAGADRVEIERYAAPRGGSGATQQENVVAEIRGRENPDEFVVLGAHLDSESPGGAPESGCNAALVIEAARDIRVIGLRPRRSIRFVLFSGKEQGMMGSWAYVNAHRAELDHAVAAVIFDGGCGPVNGFSVGGRQDLEPGVRESLTFAPLESWGIGHDTFDASARADNFDFLLEGVPNLLPNRTQTEATADPPGSAGSVSLKSWKRNTAVAGVLAFGLAEHVSPLGKRLSRAETEALLQQTGLDAQMLASGVWRDWESGRRGRQP